MIYGRVKMNPENWQNEDASDTMKKGFSVRLRKNSRILARKVGAGWCVHTCLIRYPAFGTRFGKFAVSHYRTKLCNLIEVAVARTCETY